MIKKHIIQYLRKFHLLQFVDYLMFVGNVLKNWIPNRLFLSEHPGFTPPPAYLAYDAYHHTNWQAYYDTGLNHAALIAGLIKKHVSEKQIKICEWGCGSARVIRHLEKIDGFENIELFGTDYNGKTISWCQKNIKHVHFSKNSLDPPLPLETGTFDCVYAISVFTHLSEKSHYAWIEELFRIIKPNGILIFSTHGDRCAGRLLPVDRKTYDAGSIVVKDQIEEGKKHFLTYHPRQFVKEKLLKGYFAIEHIGNPDPHYQFEQEVWVVRKAN